MGGFGPGVAFLDAALRRSGHGARSEESEGGHFVPDSPATEALAPLRAG